MKNKVTVLGGRCCDVKEAAKRNAKEMKLDTSKIEKKFDKKYKSYSDLLA